MCFRQTLIFLLFDIFIVACQQQRIALEKIHEIPEYLKEEIRFGTDIESLDKTNANLVITGVIDTTDLSSPKNICILKNNGRQIVLSLKNEANLSGSTIQDYEGDKFRVHIRRYRKLKSSNYPDSVYQGNIVNTSQGLSAGYDIVGLAGYH